MPNRANQRRTRPTTRDGVSRYLFHDERRQQTLARWLLKLGVPEQDVEDVAQEVRLEAHRSLDTYHHLWARPERWLNRIAVNVASHHRERARFWREELVPVEVIDERPGGPGVEEVMEGLQRDARLRALLCAEAWDPAFFPQIGVVVAYDINGIPMEEIARRRGMPLSTAYKWRYRGLALIREAAERVVW